MLELLVADDVAIDDILHRNREDSGVTGKTQYPMESLSSARITQLCGSRHHQGMAARMGPFPYESAESLLQRTETLISSTDKQSDPPLVVVCDRIQDAFNFGAILRSCEATAVCGVVIGKHSQVSVTPQVARSSSGAVNHLSIVQVDCVSECVRQLQKQGFAAVASTEKASSDFWTLDFSRPCVVVLGSETYGVSADLLEQCDLRAGIPMQGKGTSLNAAVACGVVLYEVRRQQRGV